MAVREIIEIDASIFRRGLQQMEQGMATSAKRQSEILQQQMGEAGQKGARDYKRALEKELQQQRGTLKAARAAGVVDPADFRRLEDAAKKAFNSGIFAGLERLRALGQENSAEYHELQRSLKAVGTTARRVATEGQKSTEGWGVSLKSLRGTIVGIAAAVVGSRVFTYLRESATGAVGLAKSYLRLSGTARLYGVEQSKLNDLSKSGVRDLQLSTRVSNELAAVVGKFASLSGDATRAEELRAAALDLGAAQGLTAAEVGEALEQTLRGQDEGLDKLLQKNPSQVYKEWAAANGVAAAKMTDTQKRLAVLTAVTQAGAKVQGEYGRQLQGDIGKLTTWSNLLETSKQRIGAGLIPILAKLAGVFDGPLKAGVDGFVAFLDRIDRMTSSPLENLIKDLQKAGVEAGILAQNVAIAERLRLKAEAGKLAQKDYLVRVPEQVAAAGLGQLGPSRRVNMKESSFLEADFSGATRQALTAELENALGVMAEIGRTGSGNLKIDAERIEALSAYSRQLASVLADRALEHKILGELRDLDAQPPAAAVTDDDAGGTPPDPDALKAAQKALEDLTESLREFELARRRGFSSFEGASESTQASIRELIALQGRLADAEKAVAEVRSAGLEVPASSADYIATLRAQRDELQKTLQPLAALPAMAPAVAGNITRIAGALVKPITDAAQATAPAMQQYSRTIAEAQEELHRGLISDEDFAKREADAAERFNQQVLKILGDLRRLGVVTPQIQKKFADLLKNVGKDGDSASKSAQKLAGSFVGVLRGVMSIADAMGDLTDAERKALQGAVDLAEGIGRIASGDIVGGSVQIIGGVVGALAGESNAEQAERLMSLAKSMHDLEAAVEANTAAVGGDRSAGIVAGGPAMLAQFESRLAPALAEKHDKFRQLALASLAKDEDFMALLKGVGEASGQDLFAAFQESLASGDTAGLERVLAAVRQIIQSGASDFGQIGEDNIAGQFERFRAELALLDFDEPAEQLQHFIDLLHRLGGSNGGGFARQLQELIQGGDVEGARKFVATIFDDLRAGRIDAATAASMFGNNFTADDIERALLDANTWLEDIAAGGGAAATTHSTQIGRSITEVQADEVVAWLEEIAHWVRAMAEGPRGEIIVRLQEFDSRLVAAMQAAEPGRHLARSMEAMEEGRTRASSGPAFHADAISFNGRLTRRDFDDIAVWLWDEYNNAQRMGRTR